MIKVTNDSYIELTAMPHVLRRLVQISIPYIFIISIIGICGNFLTIIMLSKRSLSKNFNNCTLIVLALTDLLFNFALISRCISDLTHSNSEQLCRTLSFLSHLAELLSACFTAHFTAQRFIAVRFPLSVFVEKKIHLIHYLIVTLFIIFGIIYCLALVGYNDYDICHEELHLKWFLSDALLSFLLPFTIIIILNILIVSHLRKGFQNDQQFRFIRRHQNSSEIFPLTFRKRQTSSFDFPFNANFLAKMYGSSSLTTSRCSIPLNQTNGDAVSLNGQARSMDLIRRPSSVRSKSQSYRVTRMLIIVSTCFLVLNAPSHICAIGLKIYTIQNTISVENSNENSLHLHENIKQYNQSLPSLDSTSHSQKLINQTELSYYDQNFKWAELFYVIVIITQHIAYASYSINFFLYSFCGMKFRRELLQFMSEQGRQITISRSITAQNTT